MMKRMHGGVARMLSVVVGVSLAGAGAPAWAGPAFEDDFASRLDNEQIFNTYPTTADTGVGTYGAVLTFPYGAQIDPYSSMGKALKFYTSSGAATQMLYLPAPTSLADQNFTLTVRAAYDNFNSGGFNNFAFGFARFDLGSGGNTFSDHLLVQENQIQLNFAGVDTTAPVPFSFSPLTYYTFELSYDATKAGVAGMQPFALTIDGTDVPLPVSPTTVYAPLTGIDYLAFGGRFSNGNTTRYLSHFAFSATPVPEPAGMGLVTLAILLGSVGRWRRGAGAGFREVNRWRG